MVRMATIPLTDVETQKLLDLLKSASEQFPRRAGLILAYGEGKPSMQAALQAGISRGRARYWKRQFLSRGMSIFDLATEDKGASEEPTLQIMVPVEVLTAETSSEQKVENEPPVLKEIPYPQLKLSVGVQVDDSLAEAGRKVWLHHFAIMLSHEQGTLLGEDVEELHDMRVATRRMRSAFDVFSTAFNPKIMKRYLKGLKGIGRALGQVRDMDVILGNGLSYQGKMVEGERSGLNPLLDDWRQTLDVKRAKLIKHLHGDAYLHFKQDFNIFLQAPKESKESGILGNETISRVRDIVPVLVYSRYAAVRAYENILLNASVSQLHALRIEFKKFRYTLEYFKEILGDSASSAIDDIKQYQDHLGELHDADVACQLVRTFLKEWEKSQIQSPIQERVNPEQIVCYLAYLHAERYRLMVTFPELWRKINHPEFRQNLAQAISPL